MTRLKAILDIITIDDPAEMSEINSHRNISRMLSGSGGKVARATHSRIYKTMRVGDTHLPVFTARENSDRKSRQKKLERQLNGKGLVSQRGDIQKLADYVAGKGRGVNVGVAVQQIVGRLFDPKYVATPESCEDAKVINDWVGADPVRERLLKWTGKLGRAKKRVWKKANQDTHFIHATAIAMHNMVEAVKKMRRLMKETRGRKKMGAQEAVRQSLVAPSRILRQCSEETRFPFLKKPIRKDTLVIFKLEKIHQAVGKNSAAFMEGEWSQCPAHSVVPRILEEVWKAAKAGRKN